MSKIKKLLPIVSNQIAAGEVVERPFSVVKELVENAIDAGASKIEVVIKNGGKDLIKIKDDGHGMSQEELLLSIERFATSKLSAIDDLDFLQTYGFRGEALASIASVSNLEIITKNKTDLSGYFLQVKGGEITKIEEIGANQGTEIAVKNLFFNVPARLKFLKTEATENRYISKFLEKVALINPHLRISLIKDDREVFDFACLENKKKEEIVLERVASVLGNSWLENGLKIFGDFETQKISGIIFPTDKTSNNSKNQHIFVNGRNVEDRIVARAVKEAYKWAIAYGQFPNFILNISINPKLVDVNVHPRKTEVKFIAPNDVFRFVKQTVFRGLQKNQDNLMAQTANNKTDFSVLPNTNFSSSPSLNIDKKNNNFNNWGINNYSPHKKDKEDINNSLQWSQNFLNVNKGESISSPSSSTINSSQTNYWQVHNLFIVEETSTGLRFYDQHNLCERITYEKLIAKMENEDWQSQYLLVPLQLNFWPQENLTIVINILEKVGFELSDIWGGVLLVNALPVDIFNNPNKEKIIQGLIEDLLVDTEFQGTVAEKVADLQYSLRKRVIIYTSCRTSVMAGEKLKLETIQRLMQDWQSVKIKETCPHGRPIYFDLSLNEMKKKVKR